jgi:hypothetical protein
MPKRRQVPDRPPEHDGATLALAPWREVLPGPDASLTLWAHTDLSHPGTIPAPGLNATPTES